jgi:hypothetical protein
MVVGTAFGRELKRLIGRDYGTEAAFGRAVGWSQGRVAQIVRAPRGRVSYSVLETVLSGFTTFADQERLYLAWRESHAPPPAERPYSAEWSDEEVLGFIATCPRLLEQGQHSTVAVTLTQMWQAFAPDPRRYELALATGEALQDLWSCVSRHALVIQAARNNLALAVERGDRPAQLRGMWREGLAVRPLDSAAQARPGSAYETAKEAVAVWNPMDGAGRRAKHDLACSLVRDRAALASTLFRHGLVGTGFVAARLGTLQRSLTDPASQNHLVLGKEVEARLLADLGRTDAAISSLESALTLAGKDDLTARVKCDVTKVRVLVLDGEFDTAGRVLDGAIKVAERGMMLPYYKKLADFEQLILGRQKPQKPRR